MQNIYKFIVTTSHNTYTTFCLHTENKYPMHIYTSTAHRPTRTHDPMCSTSYYPSLVSQTSQPPIHQRFPLISFLCAHRPNLEKKTCRPRAVTPKEAHTPHSTPLSTVLQSDEPGIDTMHTQSLFRWHLRYRSANVESWQQLNLLPTIPRETLLPGQAAGTFPMRKTRSHTSALDILPLPAAVPPPPPIQIDFIIDFATLAPDGLQPHAVGESLLGLGLYLSPPSWPVWAPGCSPPWSSSKSNPPKFENSLRSSPIGCPEACDC